MTVGALALLAATFTASGPLVGAAVCISVAGVYTAMPQFWQIVTVGLSGAATASGLALVISVGNVSGFVGSYLTGAIRAAAGSYTGALLLNVALLLVGLAVGGSRAGGSSTVTPEPGPVGMFPSGPATR
ncbi:hypothetical protein [Amycolatopsis sp. cmx-4-54]|uniref:hypothetical protein n=1 Tax=Amycolatopsis sp. cmx-4-54 TaxID=2790936 RepID=UPI00397B5A41